MLTSKIRTALIAAVAVAALSLPGAASARMVTPKPGAIAVKVPTHVTVMLKDAGSAGVPGYDDAACEGLLSDYNTAVSRFEGDTVENKTSGTDYGQIAEQIYNQLSSNCLVVD